MLNAVSNIVEEGRDHAISFLQRMIRTPSPSGREANAAAVVAEEMRAVGFDSVVVDRLDDAMGIINGSGSGRSILFNGHLDHVPEGEMEEPYSGRLMDGSPLEVEGKVIYGRGASDMKGALAAMIMAGKALNELGVQLKGDFRVAAVAQEEVGGAGTVATIEESGFLGDVVVIGEATNMDVALGHRGGVRFDVVVKGRSCHASAPERGVNALYKATDLISKIRSELIPKLPGDPLYGKTSVSITKISVKPDAPNVVPEECSFHIDCRNTPNYPAKTLRKDLEEIIDSLCKEDPELEALVVPSQRAGSERSFTGYYTDPVKFPVVDEAKAAVSEVLGREPGVKTWKFATDGKFYSWRGIPVVGFGPGEEKYAHTQQDHVRVDDYLESIKVYAWVACKICGFE